MRTVELGAVKINGKVGKIFDELNCGQAFESIPYVRPTEYINNCWQKYLSSKYKSNITNQSFFKLVFFTLLYGEGILPFYTKAKVAFVSNIVFDAVICTPSYPICLSLKTKLREKYKQADLEAIALQHVHHRAKSYLLTMDTNEAELCKAKITSGDIIGLNKIIDCNTSDIDNLIAELHQIKSELAEAQSIKVVTGNLIK